MKQKIFFLIPAALLALAPLEAHSGPIVDKATEAERLLDNNDPAGALDAIRSALDDVWARMPLTISNVTLVDSAEGYGVYAPKIGDVYKPGEPVRIYAELAGYALGRNNVGGSEFGVDVDIELKNSDGKTVWSAKGVMKIRQPVRTFNKEFFLKLDLNLTSAPPGRYTATYTVKDAYSDKTASFDIAFELTK